MVPERGDEPGSDGDGEPMGTLKSQTQSPLAGAQPVGQPWPTPPGQTPNSITA